MKRLQEVMPDEVHTHDYQRYVTSYIEENLISAIFLDMGLGKTIIT